MNKSKHKKAQQDQIEDRPVGLFTETEPPNQSKSLSVGHISVEPYYHPPQVLHPLVTVGIIFTIIGTIVAILQLVRTWESKTNHQNEEEDRDTSKNEEESSDENGVQEPVNSDKH